MLLISVSVSLLLLYNFLIFQDFWTALNSRGLLIVVYFMEMSIYIFKISFIFTKILLLWKNYFWLWGPHIYLIIYWKNVPISTRWADHIALVIWESISSKTHTVNSVGSCRRALEYYIFERSFDLHFWAALSTKHYFLWSWWTHHLAIILNQIINFIVILVGSWIYHFIYFNLKE